MTGSGPWYAATPTQQGIWILDRIDRLRPTYLLPSVVEFTGPVEHDVLVAATGRALAWHPALRSRFRLDVAARRVEYRTDGPPPEAGFIDAVADGWADTLPELLEVLCYSPFDLGEDAPARAEVIRVGADTTLLVLTVHHIVFDGLSRQLLLAEIAADYRATLAGTLPELRPAVHPAELAGTISAADLADQLDSAVARLRGAPTDVELPYDRDPAAGEFSMLGAGAETLLDADLSERILAISAAEGATPFMTGVALLAATLARQGKQRDFLFSVVWPGRDDPDTADAIGMFMSTLVLRITLDETTTWRELIRAARIAALETFVDSAAPLDSIAAALDPERDLNRTPLTPVLVNMAESPPPVPLANGVAGHYQPLRPQYSKWNLALFVRLADESGRQRLELALDYPAELFTDQTIADFLVALRRSAADLANAPEEAVQNPATEPDLADPTVRLELVRTIWQEVLGTEQVADEVSFFDAGGDSLRLVILVERLSQAAGRTLRTMDLFRAGTVRGQAELLAGDGAAQTGGPATSSRDRLLGAARARAAEGSNRGTR